MRTDQRSFRGKKKKHRKINTQMISTLVQIKRQEKAKEENEGRKVVEQEEGVAAASLRKEQYGEK